MKDLTLYCVGDFTQKVVYSPLGIKEKAGMPVCSFRCIDIVLILK